MWNLIAAVGGSLALLIAGCLLILAVANFLVIPLHPPPDITVTETSSDPDGQMYIGMVATIAGVCLATFGIFLLHQAYRLRKPIPRPRIRDYLSTSILRQIPKPLAIWVILITISLTITIITTSDKMYKVLHNIPYYILTIAARNETSTTTLPRDYVPTATQQYGPYIYNYSDSVHNFNLGIKLEKPSGWLVKELYHGEVNHTAITFLTQKLLPQNVFNNTYGALVLVDIENIPENMSLETFTQGKIKNLQINPSFHLITSNSTMLSGNPAHQIVFTYQSPNEKELRKGMQIWTLKNDKVYVIQYSALPGLDKFSIELPTVKHIVNSFQITQ